MFLFCFCPNAFELKFAVAQRFGRVGRGVGVQAAGQAVLHALVVAESGVHAAVHVEAAVRVTEQLRRVRPQRRVRARRRHGGRRHVIQVQVAQVEIARETEVRHGERVRGQVVAQAAHRQAVMAQFADAHRMGQRARLVHARHYGKHFRHFGLQFRDLPFAGEQQFC